MAHRMKALARAGARACVLVALAASPNAWSAESVDGPPVSDVKAARPGVEVQQQLLRIKGPLWAMYTQALRKDASLKGKVVAAFTIAPDGSVSGCHFVSSELKSPDLEQQLLARLCAMSFPAEDVKPLVSTWAVDFLPR